MIGAFVLLTLTPSAPVPKAPPPAIKVTARRAVHPPLLVNVGGQQQVIPIDDGQFVEVIVKNTSKDTIRITYFHSLRDCLYAKVTDAKGTEMSELGYHLTLFSPTSLTPTPFVRELRPGDSFTEMVNLKDDWPETKDKLKPGKYKGRIVFESGKLKAESEASFEMEITK
jgi:hypothetical protein